MNTISENEIGTNNGKPYVVIEDKKFGPVKFEFRGNGKGHAYFEPFTLHRVEYKGYVAFKTTASGIGVEWHNSYFRRTDGKDGSWKANSAIGSWVEAQAAELLENPAIVRAAHMGEIARALEEDINAVERLEEKTRIARQRVRDRQAQHDGGLPFCDAPKSNYNDEVCLLPLKHVGGCEYGKR